MKKTERGFNIGEFKDNYGKLCSLQESSAMGGIWLGFSEPEILQEGYDPQYPMRMRSLPKDIVDHFGIRIFGRMHLSQERVRLLIPYLQYFAEHGRLPDENLDEDIAYDGDDAPGHVVAIVKEPTG